MADIDVRSAKRVRMSPRAIASTIETNADFIPLAQTEEERLSTISDYTQNNRHVKSTDTPSHRRDDTRYRPDRPRSRHPLPGYEPWILVKTKLGRRFVHNTETKQSFWRIPQHVKAAVDTYDESIEKKSNAEWAEQQLRQMRAQQTSKASINDLTYQDSEKREWRRSESLQREDEAAMLAELAAQDGDDDSGDDVRGPSVTNMARGYLGAASDSEYEYVEVTDSEGEHRSSDVGEDDTPPLHTPEATTSGGNEPEDEPDQGPVEFGEDDIAYQLAMMGEEYGLEPEEYGVTNGEEGDEYDEDESLQLSGEEAVALFRQMLEEHDISPFAPWDKITADATSTSVIFDARYTLLPSGKARKDAWDAWSREQAARLQEERAQQQKQDPRVEFLTFLSRHASTKLYWPEFKRKFKREPEMSGRALQDKDREKLYRELTAKLKLPEGKRKDELQALLRTTMPKQGKGQALIPEKVLTSAILHSVSASIRKQLLTSFGLQDAI